jgi:hypothetical protein
MDDSSAPDLLKVLKTLADASRLKILGLLSQRELNVGAIARELALTEPTISHHLGRLVDVDFVKVRKEGTQRIYSLDFDHVGAFQKALGAQTAPAPDAHRGVDDERKKVLKTFVKDGRLIKIPEMLRKRRVILEWLVSQLEFDRKYPEREINAFLERFHEDFATLRRELIDRQMMMRENAIYWRI